MFGGAGRARLADVGPRELFSPDVYLHPLRRWLFNLGLVSLLFSKQCFCLPEKSQARKSLLPRRFQDRPASSTSCMRLEL